MKNRFQSLTALVRLAYIMPGMALLTPQVIAAPSNSQNTSYCNSPITIVSGDTLGGIASRCGSSVAALLANNPHIEELGAVRIGDNVYLPAQNELFSAQQLDEMLAPIALHPDVLLAEMLPAATYPLEIVQAARWQERNKHVQVSDDEPWADSVKALTRYPDVLTQMDEDIEWTAQLGEAFLAQPDDVFASIQRLRQLADAAGHLKDNDVQDIVTEPSTQGSETIIRIVHADPYYVHVPRYDPHYVYGHSVYGHSGVVVSSAHTRHHHSGVHFGVGFLLGGWLHHTLDWHHRHLFYQPYHATAYTRYYRYNHYRPYYSFSRSVSGYKHSPYRGLRWRHNSHRYNSIAANRHHNSAHTSGRYANGRHGNDNYYNGRRHEGQGYYARRNAGERRVVNGRLNSQPRSISRDNERVSNRDVVNGIANNRTSRNQRAADIKTELWKGDSKGVRRANNERLGQRNVTAQERSVRNSLGSSLRKSREVASRALPRNSNQNASRASAANSVTQSLRNQRLTNAPRISRSENATRRSSSRSDQARQTSSRTNVASQRSVRQAEPVRRAQPRVERATRSSTPSRSQVSRRSERPSSGSNSRRMQIR